MGKEDWEMSEELKPCPFCGGEAEIVTWPKPHRPVCYVKCKNCSAENCDDDFEENVSLNVFAWNTRTPDPRVAELEEALREIVDNVDVRGFDGLISVPAKSIDRARAILAARETERESNEGL